MKPVIEIFGMIITFLRSLISRKFIPRWVRMILAVAVGVLLALQVMCGGFAPRQNNLVQSNNVQTTIVRPSENIQPLQGMNTGVEYDPWANGQHP